MKIFAFPILLMYLLFCSSCSEAQIRKTGELLAKADVAVAALESKLAAADAALAAARALAEISGNEKAIEAIKIAARVKGEIELLLPPAKAMVKTAKAAHESAKAAHEAGGGFWASIIGILGTLGVAAPGLVAVYQRYRKARGQLVAAEAENVKYDLALKSATSYGDAAAALAAMEPAKAVELLGTLKTATKAGQEAAPGVWDLIRAARGT